MLMRILKFLIKSIGWLFLLLIVIFFVVYAVAPVYKFPGYKAFSGDNIYNPYRGMDSTNWIKANFQVQSRAWFGITSGRHNTNQAIQTVYKQLGYDVIVTSDYMKVNDFGLGKEWFIPTYEHGYSFRKVHQVCIGTKKVNWIDYPLYQNINHKQHIINILRNNNEIVALAHPDLRDGYTLDVMEQLSNYDLLEVGNGSRFMEPHWDAALSKGHAVFIIANDDAHDIFNPKEVGRTCTFINSKSVKKDDVIKALKSGMAFGAEIAMGKDDDYVKKAEDHKKLAVVERVEVINDTLFVKVNKKPKQFDFFGQGGTLKSVVSDTVLGFYPIQKSDTYIRTEIKFYDGTKYYLNPVYRYSGTSPVPQPLPTVDQIKTWVQRGVALIITIILFLIISRIKKGKQKKGRISRRNLYYYSR